MIKIIFMLLLILTISVGFLFLGLKVLFSRKALLLDSRWFLTIIIVGFIPQLINSFLMFDESPLIAILLIVMFVSLIGFFFFSIKGVTLFGINSEDFQEKFYSILKEKRLDYEQKMTSLTILNHNLTMSIAIQEWTGSGQIRLKKKSDKALFDELIDDLKEKEIKSNKITPIFYIIIGSLMLLSTIFLFVLIRKHVI